MHFAALVAGKAGALPQVSWLGIELRMAMEIHSKRIGLQQLRDLCSSMLKEARMQLDFKVKMGIEGIKKLSWSTFELEDDLTNIRDRYSFVSSSYDGFFKDK